MKSRFKRAILKFSGEVLKDRTQGEAISPSIVSNLANEIKNLHKKNYEIGIVLGGGNIFRGATANKALGYDRVTGDYMGMLATVINSMALSDQLRAMGVPVVVFSSMPMLPVCETYYPRHAEKALQDGKIVILAGGTGSAFFSTDSAAALRANELHADVVIKATKVDGVYDKDPKIYPDAHKFNKISFRDVLQKHLRVMDATAFSLCAEGNIPIIVVDAENDLRNIERALKGDNVGTLVSDNFDDAL